jgi:hypothetical protein
MTISQALQTIKNLDPKQYEAGLPTIKNLLQQVEHTPEICQACINFESRTIELFQNPTEEIYLMAVSKNGYSLRFIPKEALTNKIIDAALTSTPEAIKHLPNPSITQYKTAVAAYKKKHSETIPRYYSLCENLSKPSLEVLCQALIEGYPEISNIKHILPDIDTVACMILESSKYKSIEASILMEKMNIQTPKLCLAAVIEDPFNLSHITQPSELVALTAVKAKGEAIKHITPAFQNYKIQETAVRSKPLALQKIEYKVRNPKLCLIAVTEILKRVKQYEAGSKYGVINPETKYGDQPRYGIPIESLTTRICDLLIKCDPIQLKDLPIKWQTSKRCQKALNVKPEVYPYIPEKLQTYTNALIFAEKCKHSITNIPKKYYTPELFKTAIILDNSQLKQVPEELRTLELCQLALAFREDHSFQDIPVRHLPQIIKKQPQLIKLIPTDFQTHELILIALSQNPEEINSISKQQLHTEHYAVAIQKQNDIALTLPKDKIECTQLCLNYPYIIPILQKLVSKAPERIKPILTLVNEIKKNKKIIETSIHQIPSLTPKASI